MPGGEWLSALLSAVLTGYPDRARNLIVTSEELDESARGPLLAAVDGGGDAAAQLHAIGDLLRSVGAEPSMVNECYRAAFYASDRWRTLSANPLFAYFSANRAGAPLDKWAHYFPIYDRHLARYRGSAARVLEIGVYRGGGLEMLRQYLGPEAQLVGIDIDEAAERAVGGRHAVELGDQADPEFLRGVEERHGPFDVVIDDGGHTMRQQIASVETLFPHLRAGGTYLVEDTHTSYWPEYADQDEGGESFVDWVKRRADDLHAYHFSREAALAPPWQTVLAGLHVYDSVVVLDRDEHWPPFNEVSGTAEFVHYGRPAAVGHLELLATRDAAVAQVADAQRRLAEAEARDAAPADELRTLRGELRDARERTGTLHEEVLSLQQELEHVRSDLAGSWAMIEEMRGSASWRVTEPLRRIKSAFRSR